MTQANTEKVSNGIALGLVLMMFVTVGILFYFWFLEKPFLVYKNIPFPPKLESVAPGEIVPFNVERCNLDKVPRNYQSTHSLLNIETHEPILLPDVKVLLSPGCTTAVSLLNRIPPETPPGRYLVFGTAEVHGTIRDFFIEWRTEEFIVLPKVKPPPVMVVVPVKPVPAAPAKK